MMMILLEFLKNATEQEFEGFLKNLDDTEIRKILREIAEYINYLPGDFNYKCVENDECCLFAILQSLITNLLDLKKEQEFKFRMLNKTLQAKFKQEELEKELLLFLHNLDIKYKEPETSPATQAPDIKNIGED